MIIWSEFNQIYILQDKEIAIQIYIIQTLFRCYCLNKLVSISDLVVIQSENVFT